MACYCAVIPCTAVVAINPVWLQAPGEQEVLRARHLSIHQVTKLEELWRSNPAASGVLGCLGWGSWSAVGVCNPAAAMGVGVCGAPFPPPSLRCGRRGGAAALVVTPTPHGTAVLASWLVACLLRHLTPRKLLSSLQWRS